MPNTIQLWEHSKSGGADGVLYITDLDGNLNVFETERNSDGLWFNGNNGNPDNFWNDDNQWVFLRGNSLYFPAKRGVFLI